MRDNLSSAGRYWRELSSSFAFDDGCVDITSLPTYREGSAFIEGLLYREFWLPASDLRVVDTSSLVVEGGGDFLFSPESDLAAAEV